MAALAIWGKEAQGKKTGTRPASKDLRAESMGADHGGSFD